MAEWLKAAVLKTVGGETRSWVRIPVPPPYYSWLTSYRSFKYSPDQTANIVAMTGIALTMHGFATA